MSTIPQINGGNPMSRLRATAERWGVTVTPNTRIAPLVGGPHCAEMDSNSWFRPAFERTGSDAAVLPYPVLSENLSGEIEQLRSCEQVAGLLVTDPYKIAVHDIVAANGKIEGIAEKTGSVNQVVIAKNRSFTGRNNDGEGFVRSFVQETMTHFKDMNVLVLGAAGGAGRSITMSLIPELPESIFTYDRNKEGLRDLGRMVVTEWTWSIALERYDFSDRFERMAERAVTSDVIINATGANLFDFPFSRIKRGAIVVDIGRTSFLSALREVNPDITVLDGEPMSYMTNVDHLKQIFGIDTTYKELREAAGGKWR